MDELTPAPVQAVLMEPERSVKFRKVSGMIFNCPSCCYRAPKFGQVVFQGEVAVLELYVYGTATPLGLPSTMPCLCPAAKKHKKVRPLLTRLFYLFYDDLTCESEVAFP